MTPPTDPSDPAHLAVAAELDQPAPRPTSDVVAAEAARTLEEVLYETKRVIVGQDAMLERVLVALPGGWPRAAGGRARARQDAHRQDARARAGRQLPPDPVHAGPGARRPGRHADLAPGHRRVRHRARPRLRQPPPRRRDQSCARQGSIGVAGGHAGAPGHARRPDASRSAAVPRARDTEPDRVRGHLPAARGPGRPLPLQGPSSTTRRPGTRPRWWRAPCSRHRTCARSWRSRTSSGSATACARRSPTGRSSPTPSASPTRRGGPSATASRT